MNQYETQRILEEFQRAGFAIVPFGEHADVYVINTCSVTGQAEAKSRQVVRRAIRNNPHAKIVVTGCSAQMALNQKKIFEGADLLIPNPEKLHTLSYVLRAFPELVSENAKEHDASTLQSLPIRANVKIQDGCNVFCSYCSIPYTRPQMISRPYHEILREVRNLIRLGCQEIVLTGVLIGSYGPETGSGGPRFEELIHELASLPGTFRLRISSIETTQVTEDLIGIVKDPSAKVVPHLHIPLQSGSTKVLKDMNRPYTQQDYIRLCQHLYATIPNIAITTDILVGFPTETDDDFLDTLSVCEAVRFARAHVFRFSSRPGTPADGWGDPVKPEIKEHRSKQVIEITNQTRREYVAKFFGKTLDVVVESFSPETGVLKGYTENYIDTEFPGDPSWVGTTAKVRLTSLENLSAKGEPVKTQTRQAIPTLRVIPTR
ncbi:MAG: tRNA (N(6)-L-threonylcarbamoyladenosine(37)-C(2))-methylthiotransferase MtaB [Candidatus Caldarchaeum sp.]